MLLQPVYRPEPTEWASQPRSAIPSPPTVQALLTFRRFSGADFCVESDQFGAHSDTHRLECVSSRSLPLSGPRLADTLEPSATSTDRDGERKGDALSSNGSGRSFRRCAPRIA